MKILRMERVGKWVEQKHASMGFQQEYSPDPFPRVSGFSGDRFRGN